MNTGIGGGGRSCLLKLNMVLGGLKHLEGNALCPSVSGGVGYTVGPG